MKFIIFDNNKGNLIYDLRDFLPLIKNGKIFTWEIKFPYFDYIEPTEIFEEISDEDYLLLESLNGINSFFINWEKLVELSKKNIQVIEGEFIGQSNANFIKLIADEAGPWIIETDIHELFAEIKKIFINVRIINK